jgi:hypothetical protein
MLTTVKDSTANRSKIGQNAAKSVMLSGIGRPAED